MTAIRVELQVADGSFTSGMLRAGQSMASFERQLIRANPQLKQYADQGRSVVLSMKRSTEASRGFLASLRDVSVVVGALTMGLSAMSRVANSWVGEAVRVNAEMERLTLLMRGMSTHTDTFKDAGDNVKYLREQATKMPFSLNSMAGAFVKLKATGIDPTLGSFQAIADGVAAFGGTDQHLERIVLGITQMSGKGVIQMEELRQQLGESMPGAMQLMARSMGVSVAQLTKDISTGTVEAKSALAKFYAEVDRTYGGSAQRMMQSFNGQISQLKTNLQVLATGEGGKSFFDNVKKQLVDINDFLQSDFAEKLATQLAQAFTGFVTGARTAVETVWKFREEIKLAGAVLAGIWAAGLVSSALSAFQVQIAAASVATRGFGLAMAQSWSMFAVGLSGFRSLTTVMIGTQMAALGVAGAFRALIFALPLIGQAALILGGAVYYLSDRFKSNASAARDAYEEMIKYGNVSEEVAKKTVENQLEQLRSQEKRLTEQHRIAQEAADKNAGSPWTQRTQAAADGYLERLREVQAEIEKIQEEGSQAILDARDRESAQALRQLDRQVQDEVQQARASYAIKSAADAEAHQKRLADAAKNNESVEQINQEYAQSTVDTAMALEKQIESIFTLARDSIVEEMGRTSVTGRAALQDALDMLESKLKAARDRIAANVLEARKVDHLSTGEDQSKALEKGETALQKLRVAMAGTRAEIGGASSAMAELNERIRAGDYGALGLGGEEARLLHDELRKATRAKEALDKIMEGDKRLKNDLERLREDQIEKEIELLEAKAGRKFNDAEKLLLRLERGVYPGYGSDEKNKRLIEEATQAWGEQAAAAISVGDAIREEAFGPRAHDAINQGVEAMSRFLGITTQVDGVLRGLDFSGLAFGMSGDGYFGNGLFPAGTPFKAGATGQNKAMLDLIASVESGGDYNATLDHGRWTNGPKNLIGMTLKEVRALQRTMRTPENRAKYGSGKGSSALGRYQIVGQTLDGLIREMGLTGDELFDQKMQDAMAEHLLRRRQGEGVRGLRMEWAGLKNVSPDRIHQAIAAGSGAAPASVGPTVEAAALRDQNREHQASVDLTKQLAQNQAHAKKVADDALLVYKRQAEELGQQKSSDYYKELEKRIQFAKDNVDDLGKHHERLVEDIKAGKVFAEVTDPEDARYKELIKLAKELDEVEKNRTKLQEAKKNIEEDNLRFKQQELEFERQLADAKAKAKDPNFEGATNAFRSLNNELDKFVERQKLLHGEGSAEYEKALQYRTHRLQQQQLLESTQRQAELHKEAAELEEAVMTQAQIRERGMERQLDAVDRWIEKARQAGMSEVEITETAERAKAAIRAKYNEEMSPLGKQMREWGDLQGQLAQASTRWMDSLAGGLTDLIMGTGDLRSAIQGILKDVINMGVKYLMSQMMGPKTGATAKTGKTGKSAVASGGKKMFGAAHRGGIIGASNLLGRAASPVSFIGAPKFHTGGIVGKGLLPSEVPIIAKKGEGVFTPEQMEMMGGFQQNQAFQIHAPITVNGSAGTPEQNDDLSRKMAREMEITMRTVVADEIRKQTRPGNSLNKR